MPAAVIIMDNPSELNGAEKREASARRIFKRQLSPTDESNPYKKKYLSYTKNRGNTHSGPYVVQALDFSPLKDTQATRDKENKLVLSTNDVAQPRCNNINQQTAKHLVNKAYRIRHKASSNKSGKRNSGARSRRKSKSKHDNDFIYDPPRKKLKISEDQGSHCHTDLLNTKQGGSLTKVTKQIYGDGQDVSDTKDRDFVTRIPESIKLNRKKARMKFANDNSVLCTKKTVKMKNHSTIRTHDSGYQIATFADIQLKKVKEDSAVSDLNKKPLSNEMKLEEKNFTDIFSSFYEEEKSQSLSPLQPDLKASFTDLFLQDEGGNYTSLNKKVHRGKEWSHSNLKLKSEDEDEKKTETILAETALNRIYERNSISDELVQDESMKVKKGMKEGLKNPLKLKVIKRNGKVQFVNFKNEIVTFCGCCSNCKCSVDCGECKYCRSTKKKNTKGLLPCWKRRCLNPYVGEVVHFPTKSEVSAEKKEDKKEAHSTQVSKEVQNADKPDSTEDNKLEKIEACVVSDMIPSKSGEDGAVEFQVEHSVKKQRKADHGSNSDVDVFTGISPIRGKLRSTMNDLMKQKRRVVTSLPRIDSGHETFAKLPWPQDTIEDSAWISGHHICLTSDSELPDLCFLCGSAGKGKMLVCMICSEMFHPYCLDVDPVDTKNWCCDRCKRCIVCGFKGNLLMCDQCHDCYHPDCLGPFYQRDTEGDEETWYCGKCVKCTKCNQRRAGKEKASKWMFNFTMCEDCGMNWKKGNYCPICQKIFGDNDHHLKMMCCCHCERWLHMECEGISADDYEILTDLPETIPYICKLCSGKEKEVMPWYNEVRQELSSGLLKIYYDVMTHKDIVIVKERFSKFEAVARCLQTFNVVFVSIKGRQYSCIRDFYLLVLDAIETLSFILKKVSTTNSSGVPNVARVKVYFEKKVIEVFPWFSPEQNIKQEQQSGSPCKYKPELLEYLRESLVHDHKYSKTVMEDSKNSGSSEDEWAFNVILKEENSRKSFKLVDMRQCILCNHLGDGDECNTGRLLYAGANEWVHVNCALWSAEVYEDDHGRLKHVYDALKRGSKLKCDYCDQLGATIGCCWFRCTKSYHFNCACKSNVALLKDKRIYCDVHASKAEKGSTVKLSELNVPRRVVVDLSRYKSLRKVQRGLDPKSISIRCGSFSLFSLGTLTEHSDMTQTLIPIGYKTSRAFWSSKQPTQRCKYFCEVQMLHDNPEKIITEEDSKPAVAETLTYCHDNMEWENIKKRTLCTCGTEKKPRSKRGTKRKFTSSFGCEKCLANQKYIFRRHSDFIALLKKNRLITKVDHNFFPLKIDRSGDTTTEECAPGKNYPKQLEPFTVAVDVNANIACATSIPMLEHAEESSDAEKFREVDNMKTTASQLSKFPELSTVSCKQSTSQDCLTNLAISCPTMSSVKQDVSIKTGCLPREMNECNLPLKIVLGSSVIKGDLMCKDVVGLVAPSKIDQTANCESTVPRVSCMSTIPSTVPLSHSRNCSSQFSNGYAPMNNVGGERTKKPILMDINKMRTNLFDKLSASSTSSTLDMPLNTTKTTSQPPPNSFVENTETSLDAKRERIFRQLKDYLTKNPNVVNFVGNSVSKEKGSTVPVVNLTEPKSKRESVCYSVYLPEHLWNDLIDAGIAKNDIQKILAEHRKQPCTKKSNHYGNDSSRPSPNFPLPRSISPIVRPDVTNKTSFFVKPQQVASNLPHLLPKVLPKSQASPAAQLTGLQTLLPKVQSISNAYVPSQATNNLPPLQPIVASVSSNFDCYQYCTTLPNSHLLVNNSMNHNIHTLYNYTRPLSIVPSYHLTMNNTRHKAVEENISPSNLLNGSSNNLGSLGSTSSCKVSRLPSSGIIVTSALSTLAALTTPKSGTIRFPSFEQKSPANDTGFTSTPGVSSPDKSTSPLSSVPSTPSRRYNKRIKNISDLESDLGAGTPISAVQRLEDRSVCGNQNVKSGPVMCRKKEKLEQDAEVDIGTFDPNMCGENHVDTSLIFPIDENKDSITKTTNRKTNGPKKHRRNYAQSLRKLLEEESLVERKKYEFGVRFVIRNEDGFECESTSLLELWRTLMDEINDRRLELGKKPFPIDLNDAYEFFGVTKEFIAYLVEQLPGGHRCRNYKFQHHLPRLQEDEIDLPLNPSGSARGEKVVRNAESDMFAWLASPYRLPPKIGDDCFDEEVLGGMQDLPVAMKYRFLKNTSKDHVGVFGSRIQGRGLFCKKTIEQSDMIIEYSGELIRASLTDRREEFYEKRGIGCYMFRVDEFEVVDATMKGNAARFINHSCEPNCYSKIIQVDGAKKIVIYALRRINVGEELTYDYKFTHEDDKLPCYCGSKKCRKYMN